MRVEQGVLVFTCVLCPRPRHTMHRLGGCGVLPPAAPCVSRRSCVWRAVRDGLAVLMRGGATQQWGVVVHTATRPNREVANPSNTLCPRSIALPSVHLLPACHTLQSTLTWLNFRWPPPPPQLHAKMAAEQAHTETSFMSAAPPCVRHCHFCQRESDSEHSTSTSAPRLTCRSGVDIVPPTDAAPAPAKTGPRQGRRRGVCVPAPALPRAAHLLRFTRPQAEPAAASRHSGPHPAHATSACQALIRMPWQLGLRTSVCCWWQAPPPRNA